MRHDEIIEELAGAFANHTAAVWFGAGFSIPSGIPGAGDLTKELLRKASLSRAQQARIAEVVSDKIPFERVIEVVLGSMDDVAQAGFLRLFETGRPCGYHEFMALLAKKGFLRLACTTNFDPHFETALRAADVPFTVHEDHEALSSVDWECDKLQVLKVHGSCADPARMAVTVRRVAAPGSGRYLKPVVERVFAGEFTHVLVFGYSFSDRFDLSPLIRGFGNPRTRIVVVEHTGARKPRFGEEPGYDADSEHPLSTYENAVGVRCETPQFVQSLASRLRLGRIGSCRRTPSAWRRTLTSFFRDLDTRNATVVRPHLSGALLRMVSADWEALPHFRRVCQIVKKSGATKRLLPALQDLGGALLETNRLDEALSVLREAAELAATVEEGAYSDHALSQLGSAYQRLGDACYANARSLFDSALEVAKRSGDGVRCVPHLAGLASTWMKLGDLDAAQTAYRYALDAVEGSGDPYRQAELYGNIASMAYIVRDYRTATEWYDRATQLSSLAGDAEKVAIHTMNFANVLVKQGKLEEAMEKYQRAREILRGVLWQEHPTVALLEHHMDRLAAKMGLRSP